MRAILLAAALVAAAACTTTQGARPTGKSPDVWVRDIQLEPLRAEVGRPFEATLTWRDNYIREPEFDVSGLPPGLRFDPATRKVVGKPARPGFFTVNVAIRKQVSKESGHRPSPDERWWPASFQLEVYAPMKD
ncbi:MAG TPA: hypothetical protein VFU21_06135 [Kofleriaceae bacterium]|nr:hypothetical protein [Kofleriaceae bacterium]